VARGPQKTKKRGGGEKREQVSVTLAKVSYDSGNKMQRRTMVQPGKECQGMKDKGLSRLTSNCGRGAIKRWLGRK